MPACWGNSKVTGWLASGEWYNLFPPRHRKELFLACVQSTLVHCCRVEAKTPGFEQCCIKSPLCNSGFISVLVSRYFGQVLYQSHNFGILTTQCPKMWNSLCSFFLSACVWLTYNITGIDVDRWDTCELLSQAYTKRQLFKTHLELQLVWSRTQAIGLSCYIWCFLWLNISSVNWNWVGMSSFSYL